MLQQLEVERELELIPVLATGQTNRFRERGRWRGGWEHLVCGKNHIGRSLVVVSALWLVVWV